MIGIESEGSPEDLPVIRVIHVAVVDYLNGLSAARDARCKERIEVVDLCEIGRYEVPKRIARQARNCERVLPLRNHHRMRPKVVQRYDTCDDRRQGGRYGRITHIRNVALTFNFERVDL